MNYILVGLITVSALIWIFTIIILYFLVRTIISIRTEPKDRPLPLDPYKSLSKKHLILPKLNKRWPNSITTKINFLDK